MALPYGFVKAKMTSEPALKATRRQSEIQYHQHFGLLVGGAQWDVAVNVGTNDSDDLLKYKLVFDFRHPMIATLSAATAGSNPLTGETALPALDFIRSDALANTGDWRDSDVMDGSEAPEPVASLKRLLLKAFQQQADVYVFGRFYSEGDGVHDTHMNQGSTGEFLHRPGDDFERSQRRLAGRRAARRSRRTRMGGLFRRLQPAARPDRRSRQSEARRGDHLERDDFKST